MYKFNQERDSIIPYALEIDLNETVVNSKINSLYRSDNGILWIGTGTNGLYSIDCKTNITEHYDLGEACRRIRVVDADNNGNILLGTFDGLFLFEKDRNQVNKILQANPNPGISSDDRIVALHLDQTNRLWVGTDGSGVYYLNRSSMLLERYNLDGPELKDAIVRKITSSPDGQIIIATGNYGVLILDPITRSLEVIDANPDEEYSLVNNSIYGLMLDRHGSLWVGNYYGGINLYNRYDKKFVSERYQIFNSSSLSNNNVRSFYHDREGNIWIGTRNGLNLRLKNGEGYKSFPVVTETDDINTQTVILSMYEDAKGNFLIGTFAGGIKIFDERTQSVKQFRHPDDVNHSLVHSSVYDMVEDNAGNFWIATLGGVYVINSQNQLKRYTAQNSELVSNLIKTLLKDTQGRVWLGTGEGLKLYNASEDTFESDFFSDTSTTLYQSSHILCLYDCKDGTIWAGTEGDGIIILNPEEKTVEELGVQDGLADNTIHSIERDQDGLYWISTNKGLSRYDPLQGNVMNFTREDGLQSNEFYPGSSVYSTDGYMYFGGVNGLNRFKPSNIKINPNVPQVVFTKLLVKNQEVDPGTVNSPITTPIHLSDKITLTHKQTNISLHFAALGFVNPEKYQYSTFLEGFNDDWSPFSKQRIATYTNLNRGNYVLQVRVKNNDNQLSTETAQMNIEVLPAPWLTWWAYLVYVGVIATLLLMFRHYILAWNAVQHQLAFEKHEKDQIQELNQMKLRFFTNISHEFRTPLTLLNGYLDNLAAGISSKRSKVALEQVYRNSRRLLTLVDELMDFRKADSGLLKLKASEGDIVKFTREITEEFSELAIRQDINYTFQSDFDALYMWFDPGKVEKILFNLISNAFKYTPVGGEIAIFISQEKSKSDSLKMPISGRKEKRRIEIAVEDTGIGIPVKDQEHIFDRFFQVHPDEKESGNGGSGVGLAFSKRLVDIIKGELEVKSEISKGSKFFLRLPVGEGHLDGEERFITEKERFYLRLDYKTKLSETFGKESETDTEYAPGKPEILIIDDNLQIIQLLKDVLEGEYNLKFSIDGKSGLGMLQESEPDIVVTDLMMPGMSGIEVCSGIKENPVTSHIPVVILTAKTGEDSHLEGLYTGADAYISKPFNSSVLIATIDNILKSRSLLREKFAEMDTIAPSDLTRNKIDEQFLQKIIAYIEHNISDSTFDVVSLCKNVGISRSVLYRKIKALTGHSIQEFIRSVRLRKAKYLLINTDKSISEVSYQVGFSNTKYFSTSFKKEFEVSPSDFRK